MKFSAKDWEDIRQEKVNYTNTLNFKIVTKDNLHGVEIAVGLSKGDNRMSFLIKTKRELLPDQDFPDTKGLILAAERTNPDEEVYMVLELNQEDLSELFIKLSNDIFENISKANDEKELLKYYYSRVSAWTLFFTRARDGVMSGKRRIGFYAELQFIREKLIPVYGANFVEYWTGPDAKDHDFEFGKWAVEIKASQGKKGHKISISNETQLDDQDLDDLFVYFYSIREVTNLPSTIPAAIRDIREVLRVNDLALLDFDEKLTKAGYSPIFEEKYEKWGYKIYEERMFKVEDEFPRLIGSDLPNGVGGLKYKVELSACEKFEISQEERDETLDKKLGEK